jgi:hypothetical protein
LQSFVKDVSKFGVVSVTEKHCSTSLVKEAELHAQIPQESKLGVTLQLKRKVIQVCHPVICHNLLYKHSPYP